MISSTKSLFEKLLPRNNFSKSVSLLMGGTIIVQLLQLMIMPVLTRLYSPDAFGVFASFSSAVALLSIISCLSYEQAIPIPRSEKEAIGLVRLSFLLLISLSVILMILMFFLGDYFLRELHLQALMSYKYILILAVFLVGAFNIFNNFAIRERRFKAISVVSIYKGVTLIVFQLVLYSFNALGLIFGFLIGSFVGILKLKKIYKEKTKLRVKQKLHIILLSSIAILKKYHNFPFYSMPNVLLNSLGRELPVILLAAFFSPAIAGLFYLANRVVQMPVSLVVGAIASVIKGHVPSIYRDGNLASFFLEMNNQLLKIFSIPLAILAATLPVVFVLIFGDEWQEAGLISSILIPWVLMIALVNPISGIPQLLSKQKIAFYFEVILLVLRMGGFLLGVYLESYVLSISLFSFGAVIGIFIKMVWIAKISLASISAIVFSFVKEVLIAIGIFFIVFYSIKNIDFMYVIPVIGAVFTLFCLRSLKILVKGNSFG